MAMICSVVNNYRHIGGKKQQKLNLTLSLQDSGVNKILKEEARAYKSFLFWKAGTRDDWLSYSFTCWSHLYYNYRIETFEKYVFSKPSNDAIYYNIQYDAKNFCNTVLISMKRGPILFRKKNNIKMFCVRIFEKISNKRDKHSSKRKDPKKVSRIFLFHNTCIFYNIYFFYRVYEKKYLAHKYWYTLPTLTLYIS